MFSISNSNKNLLGFAFPYQEMKYSMNVTNKLHNNIASRLAKVLPIGRLHFLVGL